MEQQDTTVTIRKQQGAPWNDGEWYETAGSDTESLQTARTGGIQHRAAGKGNSMNVWKDVPQMVNKLTDKAVAWLLSAWVRGMV